MNMRAIVCTAPGRTDIVDLEQPGMQKDRAIIRVSRIGICGTDLHAFEGTQPYFSYPRILGHELAGELIDFDGINGFEKGELVTFIPYFNCGSCSMCNQGRTNCCQNLKVCGVHVDGGMTEYLSVPSKLLLKVKGLNPEQVALIEPLAVAVHAVRRANIHPHDRVLVVGAGPIGFGIMQFARMLDANVIVADVNQDRLAFCRNVLNVENTIDASKADVSKILSELTHGEMASAVFDATGNLTALQNGFRYTGHGSRYLLVGLQSADISFSHPEFHKREGTLMSSRNATREDFENVIANISSKKIDPLLMVTHHVKFAQVTELFPTWLDARSKVLKVIVELDH